MWSRTYWAIDRPDRNLHTQRNVKCQAAWGCSDVPSARSTVCVQLFKNSSTCCGAGGFRKATQWKSLSVIPSWIYHVLSMLTSNPQTWKPDDTFISISQYISSLQTWTRKESCPTQCKTWNGVNQANARRNHHHHHHHRHHHNNNNNNNNNIAKQTNLLLGVVFHRSRQYQGLRLAWVPEMPWEDLRSIRLRSSCWQIDTCLYHPWTEICVRMQMPAAKTARDLKHQANK